MPARREQDKEQHISFFRFPTESTLLAAWKRAIPREN
jgi:hypothetical protein